MLRRLTINVLAIFVAALQATAAAPVDVYILTGQSNSLGTTSNETGDYTPNAGTHPADTLTNFFWADAYAYNNYPPIYYSTSANTFKNLQMQLGDGSSNPYWWGPEFGFARTLYDAGNTNFVIIKVSNAGGGNTLWDKTTFETNAAAGSMWYALSNSVRTALGNLNSSGKTFRVRGMIYIQGEANTVSEATNTSLRFGQLYSNLTAAINSTYPGTATDMRAVIGEIGASQLNPTTRTTAVQQVSFADTNLTTAYVFTRDLPLKDGLHFGKAAKYEIGMRLANCFLGRPTIVNVGLSNVTANTITFEHYVPDSNDTNDSVNLNAPNPFTGFADGVNGQPPAGLLVSGSAGRVVFADFSGTNTTSDIQCGGYNFAGNGFPSDWTDCGTNVTFNFVDPTNQSASALVSAVGFELVSNSKTNNVTVSIYDGRGNALYNSGVITNGKFGFEVHEAFTGAITSSIASVIVQGTNNVRWTIGHITDNNVPDFAWNDWRLPTPYERWSFQIATPALRADSADADGDGVPNLIEYAMGTSATNNLSFAKLNASGTNNSFAVQFPRSNGDDISWHVERATSLSLNDWQPIATKQGLQPWTGPATVDEINNVVSVTDSDSTASEHYFRLRVTRP
jgi:hypothetical protein